MRKRSNFDMSHVNSTSMKMGFIVPVMYQECYPGDTWQFDSKFFIRVAPLVAPVMHRVWIDSFTFFVPWRILWDNWEDFITGGPDGMNASVPPTISIKPEVGSLADYFGLPLSANAISVSALPFRAYASVWNHFFRDQRLQEELTISTADGVDTTTSTALQSAAWQKDYFTTASPEPQLGPDVVLPIGQTAPVIGNGSPMSVIAFQGDPGAPINPNQTPRYLVNHYYLEGSPNDWIGVGPSWANNSEFPNTSTIGLSQTGPSGMIADLSGVTGVNINQLREAFALQRWQEKRALYGSRYEDLLHFWGLRTQDARLQQPEFVAAKHGTLQFSEVLQTSADANNDGVGALYGHGIGAMRTGRHRYYCWEHGLLLTLLIVRPQAVYTQGIERMWSRQTRYDYWNPEFEHIGQQEVLQKEIFADGTEADDKVFGYQNRYDELRRGKNHVTGEFRTTLNYWNMARDFENAPNLNAEFITCNPTDRIYQLSAELSDQLYVMVQNDAVAKRLMSRNGNPI